MTNERQDGVTPSAVYRIGSEKDLVAVKSRSMYFKRKKNDIVRIVIHAILTAALLVAVVVLTVLNSRSHPVQKICDNENCIRIAASLKQSMDTSINPCDDFFGHVCGRWKEEHYASELGNTWFGERTKRVSRSIKELLTKEFTVGEVPWAVLQAKILYGSCMDVDSADFLGLEPILRTLKNINLSRTPAALTGKHGNLMEIVAKVRRILGKDVFFGVRVITDPQDKTRNIALLNAPDWSSPLPSYNIEIKKRMDILRGRSEKLDNEYDENSPISRKKQYIIGVIREFTSNGTAANCSFKDEKSVSCDLVIKKIADSICNLTETFYDMSQKKGDNLLHYMRVNQLQTNTNIYVKKINSSLVPKKIWQPYMQELLKDIKNFDLKKDRILVGNLEYIRNVAYLMTTTDEIDLETVVWWIVVDVLVPHSLRELKILWEKFMNAWIGYKPSEPRPSYCVNIVRRMMGLAVSWLYIDPKFETEKGTKVIEMFEDVRTGFSSIITNTDWMDNKTQRVTLDKARKMTYVIGHPSWLFREGMLDNYYKGIDMQEDEFLENMLRIVSLMITKDLKSLCEYNSFNHSDIWYTEPTTINAFHTFGINHITIPAGILQFPFYDLGLEALNYGAIGTILGHELTHGFDNTGRLFDKDGYYGDWWTAKSVKRYNDKIECFVKQYSSYYVEEVNRFVDGELTLGENIADNGGLSEALLAYEEWKSRNGQEPMLPGFTNLTHEQLLFMSFAHLWCEMNSAEALRWRLQDSHCPGYLRIKGVLQNSPEFSKAWKCPLGSEMNPEKKCKVW